MKPQIHCYSFTETIKKKGGFLLILMKVCQIVEYINMPVTVFSLGYVLSKMFFLLNVQQTKIYFHGTMYPQCTMVMRT